jgi:cyclohexadienyl dehydratase
MSAIQRLLLCFALVLAAAPAWSGERWDHITATQTLRVGTPGDYKPFAMKEGAGYVGHDIDVIEALAKELKLKIEYVPTSWPNLMKDLQAGRFDVTVGGITRNAPRIAVAVMLPGYAPSAKVALVRAADKDKYKSLEDLDQPGVRVIKNPGGTNEVFVLQHLKNAQVSTHDKNAEIPGMIADGQGDVMITETYEALNYAKADPRLAAIFINHPLTTPHYEGFLLPRDDLDYVRVMEYAWDLADKVGTLKKIDDKWLR